MGIKKLSEKKFKNKKVGFIGTIKGEVVKLTVGETTTGKPYANGQILVQGAEYPTQFTVFNSKKNDSLVDQFVAACQKDANVLILATPTQESYEDRQGKPKLNTKIKVLGLVNKEDTKGSDFSSFSFLGNHVEDGTVYDTAESGSYLIFKLACTQTWFDETKKAEQFRTDNYELRAFGRTADQLAEEHSNTPDGQEVYGRVTIDGGRLTITSMSVSTPDYDTDDEIPF